MNIHFLSENVNFYGKKFKDCTGLTIIPAMPQISLFFSGSRMATIKSDKEFTATFNGWTK